MYIKRKSSLTVRPKSVVRRVELGDEINRNTDVRKRYKYYETVTL
jgi:hypothetical protein